MVFQNREFGIEIDEHGMSTWHDRAFERIVAAQTRPEGQFLMKSLGHGGNRLFREEFRIRVQLDAQTMSFIEVAAEMFACGKWEPRHEVTLDQVLERVFWDEVNPRLDSPMCGPNGARARGG